MRRPRFSTRSARHRAVTLIEAVLYISVALALIVGGLLFFQQASQAQRVSSQVRVLSLMMAEIRSLFQTSGWKVQTIPANLGGSVYVLDDVLIAAGSVPDAIVVASPAPPGYFRLQNEWGGMLQLVTFYDSAIGRNVLELALDAIPVTACARLMPKDASGKGSFTDGILDVTAWEGSETRVFARGTGVTATDAGDACRAVDQSGDGKVTLSFVFYIEV